MPTLPLTSKKPLLLALLSAGVFAASLVHADMDTTTKSATDSSGSSDASLSSSGASGAEATDSSGASTMANDSKLSDSDQGLIQDITQANLAEIMTAQLALDKSDDANVKRFAQKMLDDHTASQADLTRLVQGKDGIKLPTEPSAEKKMEYDALSAMNGEEFDTAYLKRAGVEDHRKVHASLEQAEKKAQDKDLQAYIGDTKKTVADHLRLAKEMSNEAGVRSGDSGTAGSMDTGAGSSADKANEDKR